jgi:nucleoside-diphosphate-sugar epimerase
MLEPVLVTGASGLVGYRVAELLAQQGVDVLGVDVRAPAGGAPFPQVVGDIADLTTVARLLRGRPNVVHAGAVSGPMLLLDDPHAIARANLGGAMAVFEAAYRAPVRRIVWMSSIAIYGDQPTLDPITEATRPNPQSFYGHTKLAGEVLLHAYAVRYGLNAVALRLSSVFGPRRQTACGLRAAIEAALDGRPVPVAAAGSSFRQYVHVDDAARSVILALEAPAPARFAYNVTGGSYVTEAELAAMIGELLPGLSVAAGPPAWNEGHLGRLDIAAAERDLGYRPSVNLRDGLAALADHIKAVRAA